MGRLLSADEVGAGDRLAYWNEAVSDAYLQLSLRRARRRRGG